ncbi:hypothetical protein N7504_011714 [Penicillium tannophilum]|nr:hypothetical protein N7504_011714 [Penicillium tannophilum]
MAFSKEQIKAIGITERVGSSFSLLCSSLVIATFFFTDQFQTPIHRLLFFATLGNVWSNIGMLIAFSGVSRGENSALCQFQGFPPADAFWSLCMALNIYLTCFRRYDIAMLRKLEWKYFLFSYGVPFVPAFIFLFIETESNGKVYGSAYIWCWVTIDWRALYLAVYYVPVWMANILTIWVYFRTGYEILKSRKQLRGIAFDENVPEQDSEGFRGSLAGQITMVEYSHRDHARQNIEASGEGIPYGFHQNDGFSGSNLHVAHTQTAVWPYAKRAILFFTSIVITWAPCTVNRLYSYAHPNNPSFVLNYLQSFFLPLQGFWNSCIYLSTFPFLFKRFLS